MGVYRGYQPAQQKMLFSPRRSFPGLAHAEPDAASVETGLVPGRWPESYPSYQYAQIYSQWGDTGAALRWLKTASRRRDRDLIRMKVDPLLDPVRDEVQFRTLERALKLTT